MSGPRQIGPHGLTAFVPDGDSRRDTAVLLVGTAREYDLGDRAVSATQGGFYISDELADLLYDEQEEEAGTDPEPSKKNTSGNRAAKTSTAEQE